MVVDLFSKFPAIFYPGFMNSIQKSNQFYSFPGIFLHHDINRLPSLPVIFTYPNQIALQFRQIHFQLCEVIIDGRADFRDLGYTSTNSGMNLH